MKCVLRGGDRLCLSSRSGGTVKVSLCASPSLMRISVALVARQKMRCTFECVVGFGRAPPDLGTKGLL